MTKRVILHTICTQGKIAIAKNQSGRQESNLRPSAYAKAITHRRLRIRSIEKLEGQPQVIDI